jgi:hypothetical protein
MVEDASDDVDKEDDEENGGLSEDLKPRKKGGQNSQGFQEDFSYTKDTHGNTCQSSKRREGAHWLAIC